MPQPRRTPTRDPSRDRDPHHRSPIRPVEGGTTIHGRVRDTVPDGPPARPARPTTKSGMRPRRARGGVTEIDASSHGNDPRRER
ncbi:hypothetical protein [Sandaracinus amylolyticus]|uniref:hypothetical protein n=1 Tax=Sandaracinus amylolyticus TaxID=927083 RepID=UPI001F1C816F|nr:hypothetical protein [Sandaracinus amylolyticus]UJR85135.1 Hypothetical protein I5071_72150 [Sandaracinus amylolyticus]